MPLAFLTATACRCSKRPFDCIWLCFAECFASLPEQSASEKMKLGFILFDYFPFGGLQRDCVKIARTCAARGHSVTLLTRTWQGDKPADLDVEVLGRRGFSNISRNRHFLR